MSARCQSAVPRGPLLTMILALSILSTPLGAEEGGFRFDRLSVEGELEGN